MKPAYASVVLHLALKKTLDYSIPEELMPQVYPGVRVEAPLKGKLYPGTILKIKEHPDFTPVQPIGKVISDRALITPELFELAQWAARYYCSPLRDVLQIIIPAPIRKG